MGDWRLLRADEIEIRTGQMTKDKTRQSLLLYKDARCDMTRLDEEFGRNGWQRDHKEVNGATFCGVGLWSKEHNCWVWKWDAGENTSDDQKIATKGAASDSFKRACVNWGIGRELYTAPSIWVGASINPNKLHVAQIEYNEKREIITLVISDEKGSVIYQKGKTAPAAPIERKGGAIYPAKEEAPKTQENAQQTNLDDLFQSLDDREMREYNEAIKQMKAANTYSDALAAYKRYKEDTFAPLLIDFGIKLKAERSW